jgi:hypothetical protein
MRSTSLHIGFVKNKENQVKLYLDYGANIDAKNDV